jgi:hypothetical protein
VLNQAQAQAAAAADGVIAEVRVLQMTVPLQRLLLSKLEHSKLFNKFKLLK